MKYQVILPVKVEEIAKPCLESFAPEVKKNLLVIDNSPDGFVHKYDVPFEHHPENIGVARSWNIGVRKVLEEKLDYFIPMSASVVFNKGMLDFVELLDSKLDPAHMQKYGVKTQFSWHLIALGRETLEKCGYFDTNFYPFYYEETDYIRRMELAGCLNVLDAKEHFPSVEIDAQRQGIALTLKSGQIKVNMNALANYFLKKWGAVARYETQAQRDELYRHPFNDPSLPLDYFPQKTIDELKKEYEL